MITPADIQYKEFTIAKKGYKEEEVDDFLDLIMVDMEKLIRENKKLKEDLTAIKNQFDKHMNTSASVYETLESAKSLMNDIAASAERRAENLLKNAELEASLITREAKESVLRLTEEGDRLKKKVENLRNRYKKMLEEELERMNYGGENILEEFEKEFLPASMTSGGVSAVQEDRATKVGVSSQTVVMKPVTSPESEPMGIKKEDLSKTLINIK